jgi:outer membrane protein assembly factor BamD
MLDRLDPSRRRHSIAVLALLAFGLCACAGGADEEDYVERPVGDLYNEALDTLLEGSPRQAARGFEEVERQHPYSEWATRAQLMSAYAFYQANAYDEAVNAAQRFIDLHPGHKGVAYAYYLIGVCYYERISDVGRDQKMTADAYRAFEELTRRFPDSEYARDAELKADLARDHLAGKEMEIGRYYLRRSKYIAAINRFRTVVENYQTTSHVAEALHRLTEAYLALGIEQEAERTAAVLGYNFPNSPWYVDSYALVTGETVELPRQADEEEEGAPSAPGRGGTVFDWSDIF